MAKSIYVEQPASASGNTNNSAKQNAPASPAATEEKENEIRTTLDMPVKLHKTMRRLLLEEEQTMKQYILRLIEKDLESRGIGFK